MIASCMGRHTMYRLGIAVLAGLLAVMRHGDAALAQTADGVSGTEKVYAELAQLPAAERSQRIEDGARREGKLVLIHTMRGAEGAAHVELFHQRYPFLALDVTKDIGSQDAAERLTDEEIAGRHLTDVINVALPDMGELIKRNQVARFPTPATAPILAKYRGFIDPQNRWTPWYWSEHGISYNSNLVPADKAPKAWLDLCNPFFKGSVSFDPAETRYLSGLYAMLGEAGTESLLKCMGANDPIIQRGHAQRMELMLAGDHMVQGDNYLYQGVAIKHKNPSAPFAIVYSAPILGFAGVAAINKNAQNPYAAALWVDWTLSEESQKLVGDVLRGPIALKHPFLPDDVKIITYDDAPPDVMDRLIGYWDKYMARRR
jgi:iron(III) transport system substrate-binding protein